jgi:molybdopterin synthase sulfur carrier subunit
MPIQVRIPAALRKLTKNESAVTVRAVAVAEVLIELERQFPGIKERLCDEKGRLHRHVNIYVNDEDIRFLAGESTPLKDGDEVNIISAVAGG